MMTFSYGRVGLTTALALIGQKMPLDKNSPLSLARALSFIHRGNGVKEFDLLMTTLLHVVERKWQQRRMISADVSFYVYFNVTGKQILGL